MHGRRPTYQEFKDILDPLEAPFDVGQISPRVFECATMMTPMILFRGRYSDAVQADIHYIPLEKDFSNAEAVLARLDDLEYLQGFADRAYRRLVQSGDYGYRSLARRIEDTIEQQYPLRIDPNWITYRSQVAERWTSADRTAERKMKEAPWAALAEKPTALPLGISEFNERQVHAPRDLRTTAARRYRIVGWVQKLVADQDQGRPLPSSLSLIRPVWRLLPRRVRRGIVSSFL